MDRILDNCIIKKCGECNCAGVAEAMKEGEIWCNNGLGLVNLDAIDDNCPLAEATELKWEDGIMSSVNYNMRDIARVLGIKVDKLEKVIIVYKISKNDIKEGL